MERVARVNGQIPEPLSWEQRAKGANPLPGGYSGYLDALRKILSRMAQSAMSFEQLVVWMQEEFDIAETSARMRVRFMKKAGLIGSDDGFVRIEDEARCWLDGGEDSMLIALLHSRVRFVAEHFGGSGENGRPIDDPARNARILPCRSGRQDDREGILR